MDGHTDEATDTVGSQLTNCTVSDEWQDGIAPGSENNTIKHNQLLIYLVL